MLVKKDVFKSLSVAFACMVVSLSFTQAVAEDKKSPAAKEKCAGIAQPGKGDGMANVDGVQMEWIYVPAGSCAKVSGGKIVYES